MNEIQKALGSKITFVPAVVCYFMQGDKVLLGLRKRVSLGLGENLISGIGGKVGDTEELQKETPEAALEREVFEEIKVRIKRYRKVGRVRFIFPHKPKWNQDVTAYIVEGWEGNPEETDDIKPEWFSISELPSSRMWDDNQYWVPLVLAGRVVDATFLFDENSKVKEHVIKH